MVGSNLSLLVISLALAICVPVSAQNSATSELKIDAQKNRRWKGEWNFLLGGTSFEEGKDEGAAAFLWAGAKFDYKLSDWLKAGISPRASMYSSRVQERYDDDGFGNNIWLMDAHLSFEPIEYAEVRAGALNQGYHGTSMLVSGLKSFPAVQEIAKYKTKNLDARIIIQQAVPTSHTLNTEREREEKLPMFNTETLSLVGSNFGWLDWEVTGGHFKWSNLPSKVAWEGRLKGNTGAGLEPTNATFDHAFEGWFANTEVCYCAKTAPLGFVVEYERIRNQKADEIGADAQLVGAGPKFRFGDQELDLRFRSYFIESDATVAAYNKSKYGNTNRNGNAIEANLHFKQHNFSVFAEGYRAQPINRSESQRDLSIYYLGVETDYEVF